MAGSRTSSALVLLAGLCLSPLALGAQRLVPEGTASDSLWDFMDGTWNITLSRPGAPLLAKGRWTSRRVVPHKLVEDEYRIFDDSGGTEYLGMTYRVYNNTTRVWDIRFTNVNAGAWNEAVAWKDGNEIHLYQRLSSTGVGGRLMKVRYYDIGDKSFKWHTDFSSDEGKTWVPGFDITAERAH